MIKKISFSEDTAVATNTKRSQGTGLAKLLIKSGLVKNNTQANMLFVAFIIIGVALIVYINIQTFTN